MSPQQKDVVDQKTKSNDFYKIANNAISRLKEFNIKPTPENYYVWFEYCLGSNHDLTKTIDIILSNNRHIDEETTLQLYKKFFTFLTEGEGYLKTAQKADNVIFEMQNYLNDYSNETDHYGSKLQHVSNTITPKITSTEIQEIIQEVLTSTKNIQAQNLSLKQKLDKSKEEINGLKKNLENLKKEATTDALTGIANRKLFNATLLKDMTLSLEEGQPLSLLILDIDHFKTFNDSHGHSVGDQVIRLVAKTISQFSNEKGLPARYGGEEFGIILPQTNVAEAQKIANNIRLAMASKLIQNKKTGENLGKVTVSIGVTEFKLGETMENLIDRADQALYSAKKAGRNRVICM